MLGSRSIIGLNSANHRAVIPVDADWSGYNWDVGWSEGVIDPEESGKYIEKAELSCVGGSESKTASN